MRAFLIRDALLIWLERRISGALTWAQTLANGNTSGPTSPTISAGASFIFDGTRDAPAVTLSVDEGIPSAPIWGVFGAPFAGTAGEAAESFFFETGAASADVAGPGPSSGLFNLLTGGSLDGAGLAGPSGAIVIQTGPITSAGGAAASGSTTVQTGAVSGGSRRSGNLRLATGVSTDTSGRTGDLEELTGNNSGSGDSGYILHQTGNTAAGDSGDWSAITGNSISGRAGGLTLQGGSGATAGAIGIGPGNTTGPGDGADLVLTGGPAAVGTGGRVRISSGGGAAGQGRVQIGDPTSTGTGQLADQVYAPNAELFEQGWDVQTATLVLRKTLTAPLAPAPSPTLVTEDQDWTVQSTSGLVSAPASSWGGAQVQAVGLGSYAVAVPAADSVWNTAIFSRFKRSFFRAVVAVGNAAENRYEFGVRATPAAFDNGTDDNKLVIFFEPLVYGPNWQLLRSNGGSDFVTDSGIPAAANVAFQLMVRVNDSNQGEFWISDPAAAGRLRLVGEGTVGSGLAGVLPYSGALGTGTGLGALVHFCDPRLGGNRG